MPDRNASGVTRKFEIADNWSNLLAKIPAIMPRPPIRTEPSSTNVITQNGFTSPTPKNSQLPSAITTATKAPRAIAPPIYPVTSSAADSGGINVSTILPCTLALARLDDVLAKAFWITVIVKIPGARNVINGTPITSPRCGPIAMVKIIKNSPALISGAITVCDQTFMNRLTSRRINVHVPSQLTRPNRRSPISTCFPPDC